MFLEEAFSGFLASLGFYLGDCIGYGRTQNKPMVFLGYTAKPKCLTRAGAKQAQCGFRFMFAYVLKK